MDKIKDIKHFIANIADKNYSQANTSLQKMIENKLKDRIKTAIPLKK
jgi:hypothetical protein